MVGSPHTKCDNLLGLSAIWVRLGTSAFVDEEGLPLTMTPLVLLIALASIASSSLILRIVIGYLVRPPRAPRISLRIPSVDPRWVGRRLAEILYRRKKK